MRIYNPEKIMNDSDTTRAHPKRNNHWAIVLAGGDGKFMKQNTLHWFGHERPEQFCCFNGNKTLLDQTWERAERLVFRKNIITTALVSHKKYFDEYLEGDSPGSTLYQPVNCGTAPSVMMSLAHILAQDENASIIILPSDHYIHQENTFSLLARRTLDLTEKYEDKVILFGAEATWGNPDYGWLETSGPSDYNSLMDGDMHELSQVLAIHTRPTSSLVHRLYRRNALWNTSIIACKAKTLWRLCSKYLPGLFERSEHVHKVVSHFSRYKEGSDYITTAISHAYYHLTKSDMYRSFLRCAVSDCLSVRMANLDWVDWGRPERIIETIKKYSLAPSFDLNIGLSQASKS
ncbi:sugar phosphate nucleotidyltransferase [Hahella aquimaris]|uniref:sugar phosphate nucleotidyltransferase n=1 Tax=Hahella sp. HNIBRBA332 TaxID=3015983 RepID=UPI00273B2702|nr:sugar phosphate nucleotidyltransferase [Hahella sp. HNIBRBA332]WLQ16337.1 sugar phosphate nucleotidyltransferase [Hahella sp. HNIBRBA332]